jgi:hypothetical protein
MACEKEMIPFRLIRVILIFGVTARARARKIKSASCKVSLELAQLKNLVSE